jgi:hypothetical protein
MIGCIAGSGICGWFLLNSRLPATRLTVEPSVRQLGSVSSNQTYPVDFKLANEGRLPIEIMSVQSSCSCTVATLKENLIPPGKAVTLTAKVTTGDHSGPVQAQLGVIYRRRGGTELYRMLLPIAGVVE